ncbi:MAG TPA: hypothetical protein VFV63_13305 [Ilumatobacteraceae bacterium]|nr:hypothetical protein [Ilumatobacteraceae bacterium]
MPSEPPTITEPGETTATPDATSDATGDTTNGTTDATLSPVGGRRGRRQIDRGLLVASAGIAVGLVLVGLGVARSVTGDDATKLPDEIESIDPVPDAVQVLSQTSVFVDLLTDYTGELVIDGVVIETIDLSDIDSSAIQPGQQVDIPPATVYEPGNATLTYTPSEGAPIETFESGSHRVDVNYWKVEEGRQRQSSYTWTFNVI